MFEVSEIFFSIEGEAQFTFHPTVYIRLARCNFKCPLFNNKVDESGQIPLHNGYARLGFDPKNYSTLNDLPVITKGCDSQYSVNPEFSHLWKKMTAEEIAQEVIRLLPHGFVYPTGLPVILSITGGEPTLHWKRLKEIINQPLLKECRHILIETNCAVPINEQFITDIHKWLNDGDRVWTWSNSPKLSSSGEKRIRAIRPEIALMQRGLGGRFNQYFKFVCRDESDVNEVESVMADYYNAGIPTDVPVWIMPMACIEEQQQEVSRNIVRICMERGYLYSHRIQNTVFGNGVGT